jgi:hypothetical protein
VPVNEKKEEAPHISFVSDFDKMLLWNDILQHFTLEIDDDDLKKLVRN